MRPTARMAPTARWLRAFVFVAPLLAGCGSMRAPRPLSAAEAARVAAAPRLGAVAVDDAAHSGHAKILAAELRTTGLFAEVRLASEPGAGAAESAWTAAIDGRCDSRHGGFIPWLPILTLGVVPQFERPTIGYAFTLRESATGRSVSVPCGIKATYGFGWIPALMNVLPGWSLDEPESSPRFSRRLAYAIAARLGPAPR